MIQQAIANAIDRIDLSRREAGAAMDQIMRGDATPAQIAAFLVAMRMKGERPEEIAGFAASMRAHATRVESSLAADAVDLVGTGGDGKNTFNISTVAAFVVAGAGVPVAKHGNRAVSSKCGSADVLRSLGVEIDLDAVQMGQCLTEAGIAFLFAPRVHPAMRHAVGPRREIGVRSVFNILGPICNPAGVSRQLIGVYDRNLARLLAEVLRQLESRRVLLVHSADGMDEISIAAPTHVVELDGGAIREYDIAPSDFGIAVSDADLSGGDAGENAALARAILEGRKGPHRDIVVVNAAAGLYAAGAVDSFREGAERAAAAIDDGAALARLETLAALTQRLAKAA